MKGGALSEIENQKENDEVVTKFGQGKEVSRLDSRHLRPNRYDTVERTYEAEERTYDAVERTYEAEERTYDAVERTYDTVERFYDAVERTYSADLVK